MHTNIKNQIIQLAENSPTQEICGFIYYIIGENIAKIFPCKNIDVDSSDSFEISSEDYIQALKMGVLLGIYHSHPKAGGFSDADIETSDELVLPFYVYDIVDKKFMEYIPIDYKLDIVGLQFVLGFHDCYEIPRIHYRQNFKIYMGDYDRDESFIHEDQNVIIQNYEKEGFTKVDFSDIKKNDVIIFRTEKILPQHFGIFMGDSRFLHHPRNALSIVEILSDRWISRIVGVFRHKIHLNLV